MEKRWFPLQMAFFSTGEIQHLVPHCDSAMVENITKNTERLRDPEGDDEGASLEEESWQSKEKMVGWSDFGYKECS